MLPLHPCWCVAHRPIALNVVFNIRHERSECGGEGPHRAFGSAKTDTNFPTVAAYRAVIGHIQTIIGRCSRVACKSMRGDNSKGDDQ
jgi:hypothetical protein